MNFGEKLQVLREQSGLSQEELAIKLGVSNHTISNWELGATVPDAINLLLISNLYSVSIDYLLKDDSDITHCEVHSSSHQKECKSLYIIGVVEFLVGMIISLLIGIFSSIYPAIIYDPPQGEIRSIVKTGFSAFLELHNIRWLFGLGCILFFIGIITIIYAKRENKSK